MHGHYDIALEKGVQLFNDPYVQRILIDYQENLDLEDEEVRKSFKSKVFSRLIKEAHETGYESSHSARVSALSKAAAILGLEQPTEVNLNNNGCGAMVIPAIANVDDWEALAQQAQVELQRKTQDGS